MTPLWNFHDFYDAVFFLFVDVDSFFWSVAIDRADAFVSLVLECLGGINYALLRTGAFCVHIP